jgi:hypothetical protein
MKHIKATSKVRKAELNYEELITKVLCMVDPEAEKCQV